MMKENIEIIMSCLFFEEDKLLSDLLLKNIQTDILIINQCNETFYKETPFRDKKGLQHKARILSIKQRGLSQSRNLAIDYAEGDILLLADDDEVFEDSYPETISKAYERDTKADVILFDVKSNRSERHLSDKEMTLGYIDAMRASSHQISFRRLSIKRKGLRFDVTMGAGTGMGGGEENKFLFDCLRKKLRVEYFPKLIAFVEHSSSTWFKGYTKEYFINRGYSSKKLLGTFLGMFYIVEWSIAKYHFYKNDMTLIKSIIYQMKGLLFKH